MKGFWGLLFIIATANGFSFERLGEGVDNSLQVDQDDYYYEALEEEIDHMVKNTENEVEAFEESVEDNINLSEQTEGEELGIGQFIAHLLGKIVAGFVVAYHSVSEDIKSLEF